MHRLHPSELYQSEALQGVQKRLPVRSGRPGMTISGSPRPRKPGDYSSLPWHKRRRGLVRPSLLQPRLVTWELEQRQVGWTIWRQICPAYNPPCLCCFRAFRPRPMLFKLLGVSLRRSLRMVSQLAMLPFLLVSLLASLPFPTSPFPRPIPWSWRSSLARPSNLVR